MNTPLAFRFGFGLALVLSVASLAHARIEGEALVGRPFGVGRITISGGEAAIESPTMRNMMPSSWKPRSIASKPRLPTPSGFDARSMPTVRPTQRMSRTLGRPFRLIAVSYQSGSSFLARANRSS